VTLTVYSTKVSHYNGPIKSTNTEINIMVYIESSISKSRPTLSFRATYKHYDTNEVRTAKVEAKSMFDAKLLADFHLNGKILNVESI